MLTAPVGSRVSIAKISTQCQLSAGHFARAFKHSTGISPHRVEKAKEMLLAGHTPLEDVASACGFGNQRHMTEVFTRHIGESPAAWGRARKTWRNLL
jgi:AraC family transcriptional regulator